MNWKSPMLAVPLAFALAAVAGWWSRPVVGSSSAGQAAGLSIRSHDRTPLGAAERQVARLRALEGELRFAISPPQVYDAKGMEEAIAASNIRTVGFVACGQSDLEFDYGYRWARAAPEAMFAWLSAAGSSSARRHSAWLFICWAERDLPAAYAAAVTLTHPELRQAALLAVVEAMLKSDPARARVVFEENLNSFTLNEDVWFISDDDASRKALEMLLSLPPSPQRSGFLACILKNSTIFDSQADVARKVWDDAPQDFREELVAAGFVSSAAHADSFSGLGEITRRHVEVRGTQQDIATFLESHGPAWAQRDLPGALAWTAAHMQGRARFDQTAKLIAIAAGHDYPAALEAWKSLPDGYLKRTTAVAITRTVPPEVNDPEVLSESER